MSDYIRREDAFDAVEARIAELMTHPEFRRKHLDIDLSGVIRNISAIKPADVMEVKHGYWISECEPHYECSECHHWFHLYQHMNFCPNCGAKMDRKE